ncbi:outer membrane protein [Methylobacterium gnaphalii]|uniref:Outer-membrane immunogenic protein n=1 Tax=Methylobacterium gnaphalii TaxID=1010610 RepID=A0A512JN14_9HYPH|nr:porin family protein [Methylobacterium gnaphalii]GEP11365.1 outer-membrane immunogenic protein [Methylobacterium gnaphalii]GJD71405.1 hypothetical protein MMMDOFMJ_4362 [Methylobacterium gnaphalii]GLS47959.1 outer-membrane immunogenic protein [Methylobacterium gnaphalii]
MKMVVLASTALALIAGAASAADLPRRAAPPPVFVPPPVFTWSGVYIGTHTAYTFNDRKRITTTANEPLAAGLITAGIIPSVVSPRTRDDFANFGGGFGINYQLTPGSGFVIGAAIDADWTDLRRTTFVNGTPVGAIGTVNAYTQQLDWLATANGRIGYAFDRLLVYGTGGAAIGHVRYGHSLFVGGGLIADGGNGGNEVGYNFGGGIEYAIPTDSFLSNLSVLKLVGINLGGTTTLKAEYIHFDLGSKNVNVTDAFGAGLSATSRFRTEGNMVRAGFSYKFP